MTMRSHSNYSISLLY